MGTYWFVRNETVILDLAELHYGQCGFAHSATTHSDVRSRASRSDNAPRLEDSKQASKGESRIRPAPRRREASSCSTATSRRRARLRRACEATRTAGSGQDPRWSSFRRYYASLDFAVRRGC